MNTSLKLTFLILLTLNLSKLHAAIDVSVLFIEAPTDNTITANIDYAALGQIEDVDLMSSPKVSMEPGKRATINIGQDFYIPEQGFILIGFKFEITADLTLDGYSYSARSTITEFDGPASNFSFYQYIHPHIGNAQDNVPILFDISNKHEPSKKLYVRLILKES